MSNIIILEKCSLILERDVSKKGKTYIALYLVTENNDKIFLNFAPEKVFDNLKK